MRFVLLFVAALIVSRPAWAVEPTLGLVLDAFSSNDPRLNGPADAYIEGVMEAYTFANAALTGEKRAPLFCAPANLSLSDVAIPKMRAWLARRPQDRNDRFALMTVIILQDAYPCR